MEAKLDSIPPTKREIGKEKERASEKERERESERESEREIVA
jgi:hypothetical protein